jgi:hypothetical protein
MFFASKTLKAKLYVTVSSPQKPHRYLIARSAAAKLEIYFPSNGRKDVSREQGSLGDAACLLGCSLGERAHLSKAGLRRVSCMVSTREVIRKASSFAVAWTCLFGHRSSVSEICKDLEQLLSTSSLTRKVAPGISECETFSASKAQFQIAQTFTQRLRSSQVTSESFFGL